MAVEFCRSESFGKYIFFTELLKKHWCEFKETSSGNSSVSSLVPLNAQPNTELPDIDFSFGNSALRSEVVS